MVYVEEMMAAATAAHKAMLAKMTPLQIQEKIRAFRRLDLREMRDEALEKEVLKVFSIELPGGARQAWLLPAFAIWGLKTRFYRARRLSNLNNPPQGAQLRRDAEAKPSELVTSPGRINRIGEPMLYTCIDNPLATFSECRIPIGGYAVVFVYRPLRPVRAAVIGSVFSELEFSDEELLKINMINDFLHDEFAREVEPGLEHLYRPSEHIAKFYFDLPDQDCWTFPSTKNRAVMNAAFRPERAKECLELVGSTICERTAGEGLKVYAIGRPTLDRLEYFPIGSDEQKALFPELNVIRPL